MELVNPWRIGYSRTATSYLFLGARLDPESVAYDYEGFAPKAQKIIVDVDEAEINKHTFPHFWRVSTVKDFLAEDPEYNGDPEWLEKCRSLYEKYPVIRPDHKEPKALCGLLRVH